MRTKLSLIVLVIALAVLGGALPAAAGDRPNNGQISFGRFDPALGDFSIWAANPDGSHQQRLTHIPSFFSDWSPDGRRIAFDFADDTGVHIATMDPNGRNVRQLTFGPAIQEIPDWSPDGRRIAFNAAPVFPGEPGFHTDIWIMRADGSHKRQLTRGAFDDEPVFSPDGRRIAFGRRTQDADIPEIAIYVMNRDGTHQRQVVPETLGLAHHDWSPDGRWIAFQIAPERTERWDHGRTPRRQRPACDPTQQHPVGGLQADLVPRRPQAPGRLLRRPSPNREALHHEPRRTQPPGRRRYARLRELPGLGNPPTQALTSLHRNRPAAG